LFSFVSSERILLAKRNSADNQIYIGVGIALFILAIVIGLIIHEIRKRAALNNEGESKLKSKAFDSPNPIPKQEYTGNTATLCLPSSTDVAIPLYLKYQFGVDFTIEKEIASGAFGSVHIGKLIKQEIITERNGNDVVCAVKKPKSKLNPVLFRQELSIHEVFQDNKNFAKLLGYSEDPYAVLFKYYKFGSLRSFIKSSGSTFAEVVYTPLNASHLSVKLALAIRTMHIKGFVHNDLKPDNILLDGDAEEPLFPVICDFGIAHITSAANVVAGFEFQNIKAGTPRYCAPEILLSFKENKIQISSPKSDIFSLAIVLLELFTRKDAWPKSFDKSFIMEGGLPTIDEEILARLFTADVQTMVETLKKLLTDCLTFDPPKRPTMCEVCGTLSLLEKNLMDSNPSK